VTLNDPETGIPFAVLDATSITALRTAGHAAVGAKYLARVHSRRIAIIGCGAEGSTHLRVMNELFDLEYAIAYDVRTKSLSQFVSSMAKNGIKVKAAKNAREAVRDVDVICMTTTAPSPVVMEEWIEPGSHVAATGFFFDLDPTFSKKADKWVVGNWERDLMIIRNDPWTGEPTGLSEKDVYADLSEIIVGRKPGRENDRERTVMTHAGMGALDVAVGFEAYKLAKRKGMGVRFKLF
jgi:ornithine cyclodeaminase/alanine dehydrogenase-like protein (mu-crystallin family)